MKPRKAFKKKMTEYYSYITKDSDRWDLIAYRFYKNPTMYEEIIKANPNVPIEPTLPAGIKLRIPVFDDSETIKFDLPLGKIMLVPIFLNYSTIRKILQKDVSPYVTSIEYTDVEHGESDELQILI